MGWVTRTLVRRLPQGPATLPPHPGHARPRIRTSADRHPEPAPLALLSGSQVGEEGRAERRDAAASTRLSPAASRLGEGVPRVEQAWNGTVGLPSRAEGPRKSARPGGKEGVKEGTGRGSGREGGFAAWLAALPPPLPGQPGTWASRTPLRAPTNTHSLRSPAVSSLPSALRPLALGDPAPPPPAR